jgi:hypothetical protein
MRRTPGVRRGVLEKGGSISIPQTIAFPRTVTSRSRGAAITATSVPSTAFYWVAPNIHCTLEWMLRQLRSLPKNPVVRCSGSDGFDVGENGTYVCPETDEPVENQADGRK